jgi:putative NADPH-quinone reductase
MNVLIIFAHPNVEGGSIGNKTVLEELKKVPDIEIRELYKLYPDFKIDVAAEQKALLAADLVVFQFPFYWYSTPALLKEWQDLVLEYGFAYGSTGDKLHGKELLVSTTIGGPEESYCETGYNTFPVDELLKPLQQTANLTGMKFVKPIATHGVVNIPGFDLGVDKEVVIGVAKQHADRLIEYILEKKQLIGVELLRDFNLVEEKDG